MTLVKWEPYNELITLRDRMGRIFSSVPSDVFRSFTDDSERPLADWIPAVDIFEDAETIVLKAELPELDMKDIDVKVEGETLRVSGERKLEKEEKKENYHRVERVYGSFSRSFTLPHTVDTEKIRATYDRGILRIMLPKKEETKPKKIAIDVK